MNKYTKELCEKLLLCKFSVDEIHDVLLEYIADLDYTTDPDVQASHWCVEDVETCIAYMGEDEDDYDKSEFPNVIAEFIGFIQQDYGMSILSEFVRVAKKPEEKQKYA